MVVKAKKGNVRGYPYAILTNATQTRSRLGWVSASTGVTYCGICLRAPITEYWDHVCHVRRQGNQGIRGVGKVRRAVGPVF
jgi:hypothetical protein